MNLHTSGSICVEAARLDEDGPLMDVVVRAGHIESVEPTGGTRVEPPVSVRVRADGGRLLPGLHDHHLHLLATAAADASVHVGPPGINGPAEFEKALRDFDRHEPADRWLRGVGYHESVAGPLTRHVLDALVPDRPLRIQHRTGQVWFVNTAGLERLQGAELARQVRVPGIAERRSGVLERADDWLRVVVDQTPPDLAPVGSRLAMMGITGVTDTTPVNDPTSYELLARARRRGELPVRIAVCAAPDSLDLEVPVGLETGPVKIVLDEVRLPAYDTILDWIRRAHQHGRPVAVHCVDRSTLAVTIAALDEIGSMPGDRIEHGSVIGIDALDVLHRLGVTVVTQPGLVHDRGDRYLVDVDAADRGDLYRFASLRRAGIAVASSSDSPYSEIDPWRSIWACTQRRTRGGAVLGGSEAVPAESALESHLGELDDPGGAPRRLRVGARADLCLLKGSLRDALGSQGSPVRLTMAGGEITYRWDAPSTG
jgi:predicted amidohydrolase YtcJ